MRYTIQSKNEKDLEWSWRFDTPNKRVALDKMQEMIGSSEAKNITYRVINNYTNQIIWEETIYGC